MKYCNHSHWLGLSMRDDETTFTVSDRARTLLYSLPFFESQKPSLFVLFGNDAKTLALKELASVNIGKKSAGRRSCGEIHLQIDSSTTFGDRPILYADGDFPVCQKLSKVIPASQCHETTSRILPGLRNSSVNNDLQTTADKLHFKLLSPFTDVFCFFAADLGGLQSIAFRIASWLDIGQSSTLPSITQPQIVIVTESSTSELQEARILDRFLELLANETKRDISSSFAGIRVLSLLPDGQISTQARHRRLKECLMAASDQVRSGRIESRTLFSAQHFTAFFNHACSHFVERPRELFNFIKTSRLRNPPATDLKEHLTNLLLKIESLEELRSFGVPLIASSLLLDNYPPDMHRFGPRDVFQSLYKDACYQACRNGDIIHKNSTNLVLPSGFTKMVEDSFCKFFNELDCHSTNTAVDLHRRLLRRFPSTSLSIRSDETCFVCTRRRPQHGLPCGHRICDICIRVFGRRSQHDPWLFEVTFCIFCALSTSEAVVKTLPPTAGVRVLTLDGGGVRGLAHLQYLQVLEDKIGLEYPVQDNFDVIYGTSAGGIVNCGVSVEGWTVKECSDFFERCATFSFQPRLSLNIPIISSGLDLLFSYFNDGRYRVDNLEASLQEAFGDQSILDYSRATATGKRIGLLATTIHDTTTCVFTNYNGVGTRPRDCGYHVLRPKRGLGQVPLWEIARCGSAAPSYFKPKHISGLGTFQDGGLVHNNPEKIAEEEVLAMFDKEPSLVVSLGTGHRRSDDVPRMSSGQGILKDGFIPRLFRAFNLLIGSPDSHKFRSHRSEGQRERYFRFDIEFDGPEPRLDDITKMQELKDSARKAIYGSRELDRLARCILAELFVFELESEPWQENGHYICVGHILCRIRANNAALNTLLGQLIQSSAKLLLQSQSYSLSAIIRDGSCLDRTGNFRLRVAFEIPNRKSSIFIRLQEGSSDPCSISGSPFSIDRLVAAQQLDACFGRADHVKRKRVDSTDAVSSKKRRRILI